MIFEEMLREEKQEGILEDRQGVILDLLEDVGEIPEVLQGKIENV